MVLKTREQGMDDYECTKQAALQCSPQLPSSPNFLFGSYVRCSPVAVWFSHPWCATGFCFLQLLKCENRSIIKYYPHCSKLLSTSWGRDAASCSEDGTDFQLLALQAELCDLCRSQSINKGIPCRGAEGVQINFPEVIWLYQVIQSVMDMDIVCKILQETSLLRT